MDNLEKIKRFLSFCEERALKVYNGECNGVFSILFVVDRNNKEQLVVFIDKYLSVYILFCIDFKTEMESVISELTDSGISKYHEEQCSCDYCLLLPLLNHCILVTIMIIIR